MDHQEANSLFGDYFLNKLDREATKGFHAHLNECEDCRVRLRATRAAAAGSWKPGYQRGGPDQDEKVQRLIYRNRVITYAVVAVLVAFVFFFRIKTGG